MCIFTYHCEGAGVATNAVGNTESDAECYASIGKLYVQLCVHLYLWCFPLGWEEVVVMANGLLSHDSGRD